MIFPPSTRRHISSRSVCLLAVIALLPLFVSYCARDTSGKSPNVQTGGAQAKVKILPVEQRQQQRVVEAVGSLFAYDEVVVSSEAEGRVEEVMADVGDRVGKGQALARVSPVE